MNRVGTIALIWIESFLTVLSAGRPAQAVPFEIIVPNEFTINTNVDLGGHIADNIAFAYFGWVAASSAPISANDFRTAVFQTSDTNDFVTFLTQKFISGQDITVGQVWESFSSNSTVFQTLLNPGETLKGPVGGGGFWNMQILFPAKYDGDAILNTNITMGTDRASYSALVHFRAGEGSLAPRFKTHSA